MFNRTRWSAFGAAVAVTVAGGVALPSAHATNTNGGGGGVVFVPVVPCRLFDTRANAPVGQRTSPLGANDTYTQSVTGTNGNCTIPAGASAVAMNVTTVNATATSFLTIWPADAAQPLASNLNWVAGSPPTPNKVDVKLSADGRIKLFNNGGTVDVLADIVGYYADHNHDDRYYTKAETDAKIDAVDAQQISILPPSVMSLHPTPVVPGVIEFATIANCVGSNNLVTEGRIPLTVPFPALRLSVAINVLDGSGTFPITVSLYKLTRTDTGLTATTLDTETFSGSETAQLLTSTLDLPLGQTIDGSGSYEVSITGLANNHNAFCGGALLITTQDSVPVTPI